MTEPITAVYALTASYCTFEKAIEGLKVLLQAGFSVIPAMSYNAAGQDTRYGKADDFKAELEKLCRRPVIDTLQGAEPIGPQKLADIFIIAPCTGNTLAKLALGIVDTPVLMGAKSQLRSGRPVVLALSTNDALSGNAQNLGRLLNTKNIYFVPMQQDDYLHKPSSLSADYGQLENTVNSALRGRQIEPVLLD